MPAPPKTNLTSASAAERQRLVEQHLDYAHALAVKLAREIGTELPPDELKGYAAEGLLEAAERYEPARGVAFTTFAYYRIRGAVFDGLREIGWLDRRRWARQRAATDELLDNLGQRTPPSSGSVKEELTAVADTLDQVCTVFLAAEAAEDIPDDNQPGADEAVELNELAHAVRQAVRTLPRRERKLIELFYFKGKSLKAAGAKLGLSKSWASRLHARAIGLLTQSLQI